MSKFFIERPILANVIAIITILLGAVCLYNLPVAQYPQIVPPTIQVSTSYAGAELQRFAATFVQHARQHVAATTQHWQLAERGRRYFADREQQARSEGEDRFSTFSQSQAGGLDTESRFSGGGGGAWADRLSGGAGGAARFSGGGFRGRR